MPSASEQTPWSAWLRAALALGVPPASFWRLSVKEWRALLDREGALDRAGLDALMQRFPDGDTEDFR